MQIPSFVVVIHVNFSRFQQLSYMHVAGITCSLCT